MEISNATIDFLKDWVVAPVIGIFTWFWTRNERKHREHLARHLSLEKNVNSLGSQITDRMMAHIDDQVSSLRAEYVKRTDQLAENDRTLFANAEKDRSDFRDMMQKHSERSEERHRELMHTQMQMIASLGNKADRK